MVLLPILIHQIPFSGSVPLGAILLPMFIMPLIGSFFISPIVRKYLNRNLNLP
jgi:hypothetical protein